MGQTNSVAEPKEQAGSARVLLMSYMMIQTFEDDVSDVIQFSLSKFFCQSKLLLDKIRNECSPSLMNGSVPI